MTALCHAATAPPWPLLSWPRHVAETCAITPPTAPTHPLQRRLPGLLLAALVVAHAALWAGVPLRFFPGSVIDEALFVRLARHIAAGEWLGPYDHLTLAKGAGFPLWLAAVHGLGLSVNVAASLWHGAACALAYVALRPWLPAPWPRLGIAAAVLFGTPLALGDLVIQRELVYPATCLALTAAALGWRARAGEAGSGRWAVLAGALTAIVALTREEAVWLAPLALLLVFKPSPTEGQGWALVRRRGAALLPFTLAAALPLLAVAALNLHHYGHFVRVESNSAPFSTAYAALERVAHDPALPRVPLPRHAWSAVAEASPAFRPIHAHLRSPAGQRWAGPSLRSVAGSFETDANARTWLGERIGREIPPLAAGTAEAWFRALYREDARFRHWLQQYLGGERSTAAFLFGAMDQEVGAAFFVWALREGAAAAGHHADAGRAARFYRQLADEVQQACAQGALRCTRGRDRAATASELGPAVLAAAQTLLHFETLSTAQPARAWRGADVAWAVGAPQSFLRANVGRLHAPDPPHPVVEPLLRAARVALPLLAGLAVAAWLFAAGRRRRGATAAAQGLLGAAGVLLLLVVVRLLLVAWVHVTGWSAALEPRYVAPAQPLLVLFIALAAMAAVAAARRPGVAGAPPP